MSDQISNPPPLGGTTSAQGVDPAGRNERAKSWYQKNAPSGVRPVAPVTILNKDDDAATATARALALSNPGENADQLIAAGAEWSRIRGGISTDPEVALAEAHGLAEDLRAASRQSAKYAQHLTTTTLDDFVKLGDGIDSDARRVLLDALQKLPEQKVGQIFRDIASRFGKLRDFERARLVNIVRLVRAGAIEVPSHDLDAGISSLINAQPARRAEVDSARDRSRALAGFAGVVEREALASAAKLGVEAEARSAFGLDEFIPAGETSRAPLAPRAAVLDIPADEATRRAWRR